MGWWAGLGFWPRWRFSFLLLLRLRVCFVLGDRVSETGSGFRGLEGDLLLGLVFCS